MREKLVVGSHVDIGKCDGRPEVGYRATAVTKYDDIGFTYPFMDATALLVMCRVPQRLYVYRVRASKPKIVLPNHVISVTMRY